MKPGDLVVPLPGYTEMKNPPAGIILERASLDNPINRGGHSLTGRFLVLFPQGIFPMYDFEMEVISE